MFAVGSKVVHPCYGAGTVVHVQKKSIGDDARRYYVIEAVCKSMQVMVPVSRADDLGLREVGRQQHLMAVLQSCAVPPVDGEIESDLRARQAEMRDQLKSGSFTSVADVVRKLFFLSERRPLGTVDRQLFDRGKDLLASELALASDRELDDAMQLVEEALGSMTAAVEQD
jgi:CarD family transcriptional regulator